MADIKALKDAAWLKKEEIKKEEQGLAEWQAQLDQVNSLIELQGSSKDTDDLKQEMLTFIATHEASLARLRPELDNLQAQLPQAPQPAAPKFDPEKHPLLRKTVEKQEPEKPITFSTGDMIEAQWTDRSWYKAKIQSVLGSTSAPKYLVRFIEYDDSITVDRNAIRPLSNKRRRDPEPAVAPSPTMPSLSTPHVISGPASINPNVQKANQGTSLNGEVKPKSRIANKGQLKKKQGAWQEFQAKSSKKIPKKESMFRTSTEAGSRVGFTGSGKGMTETHKRARYDYKADIARDEDYANPTYPTPFQKFTPAHHRKRY